MDRRGNPLPEHLVNQIRRLRVQDGMSIRDIVLVTGVAKSTVERYAPKVSLGRPMTAAETEIVDSVSESSEDDDMDDEPTIIVVEDDPDFDEFEPKEEEDIGCASCGVSLDSQAIPRISRVVAPGSGLCDGCAVRETDNPDWARQMRGDIAAKPEDLSVHDDDPLAKDL